MKEEFDEVTGLSPGGDYRAEWRHASAACVN